MPEPALRFEGRSWTRGEFAVWVGQETTVLARLGVGAGDRVAVLAQNHPRTLALLFACARLGAMLAPLNWRLAGPELDWIVGHAAPRTAGAPHYAVDRTAAVIPLRYNAGAERDRLVKVVDVQR